MIPLDLSANECRVIGCLMEKSTTTPDQYPLTLNALTNACNQKSSRDPVMSLTQGVVQHTARELERKHSDSAIPDLANCSSSQPSIRSFACSCYAGRKPRGNFARAAGGYTNSPITMKSSRR